jgi:hypothetical protein
MRGAFSIYINKLHFMNRKNVFVKTSAVERLGQGAIVDAETLEIMKKNGDIFNNVTKVFLIAAAFLISFFIVIFCSAALKRALRPINGKYFGREAS